MKFQIIYHRDAEKFLDKISEKVYLQISSKIRDLAQNPYSPHLDVKKLQGGEGEYRLRVGNYRVLYTIENDKLLICVIKIGHRKNIYE